MSNCIVIHFLFIWVQGNFPPNPNFRILFKSDVLPEVCLVTLETLYSLMLSFEISL